MLPLAPVRAHTHSLAGGHAKAYMQRYKGLSCAEPTLPAFAGCNGQVHSNAEQGTPYHGNLLKIPGKNQPLEGTLAQGHA